eukprot:COSAG02_NODE_5074_length_4664_cov_17.061117_1_plen_95_part_00
MLSQSLKMRLYKSAVEGMPLIESDSVLGANSNKWEAHAGATAPGQFCAFDSSQGRAVRNFYTDFANEVIMGSTGWHSTCTQWHPCRKCDVMHDV